MLLTLSMGPFFIFVYYLITETSKPQYDIEIVNIDKGIVIDGQTYNHGKDMVSFFCETDFDINTMPFKVSESIDKEKAIEKVKKGETDALLIIGEEFSQSLVINFQT